MRTFAVAFSFCLVVIASAKPSGLWGAHGVVAHTAHVVPSGPTTLIGASGVVGPHGASGPTGAVNGHGAVGPNGEHNALDHGYAGYGAQDDGQWHGEGLLESQDYAGHGAVAYAAPVAVAAPFGLGHDDGQWHGEGLLESQDHAGHGAVVFGGPVAVAAPALAVAHHGAHGDHAISWVGGHSISLNAGHGLGHGAHW